MRTFGKVVIAVALVTMGCGDDNNDNNAIGDASGVTTFQVTLTPAQETPPCLAAGSAAIGTVNVSAADDNSVIQVNALQFSGLSGPATSASINQGAIGVTGPVVFPLSINVTPFSTIAFNVNNYPTPVPAGASATFAAFVDAMRSGDTYITVATSACPNGEIRAQIQ